VSDLGDRAVNSKGNGVSNAAAATQHTVWLANQHGTHSDLMRVNAATGRIVARP
jgi:hypothetical protein